MNKEAIENLYSLSPQKIKIVIRHAGNGQCVCPGCVCPGCPCPLGICFCIPISNEATNEDVERYINGKKNDLEKSQGIGYALANINKGKLHLVFGEPTALANGTIPIDEDYILSDGDLSFYKLDRKYKIPKGAVNVSFARYKYGEAYFDLIPL